MPDRYIAAGRFVGTHGVRGELRLEPWCDGPDFLKNFKVFYSDKNGTDRLKIRSIRPHGNICIVKLDGVDSIEQAETFRFQTAYIDRNDCTLEEGRYFIQDIIGCEVYDNETDKHYGTVSDVTQTGANDVWHIDCGGAKYMIPNVPAFVKHVDIENKRVRISPLKGMFDDSY